MKDKTEIKNLTFEDFKKLAKEKVRKDNHLDRVESWEEKILHYEFHENSNNVPFYSATIYFIDELFRETNYCIKMYKYSYCINTFYDDGYDFIDRQILKKIALLEGLVSRNNERYLFTTIKKFQECVVKIK